MEFALVAGSGLLVEAAYVTQTTAYGPMAYVLTTLGAALAMSLTYQATGLYSIAAMRSLAHSFGRLWLGWTLVCAAVLTAMFFFKAGADFSRVWLATWYFTGFLLVMLTRASLAIQLRRWAHDGRLVRKAIIIGDAAEASAVARQFARADGGHIEICGLFDDRAQSRDPHAAVSQLPMLGSTAEAADFARSAGVDLVIIALPISAEDRLLTTLKAVKDLPADIRLSVQGTRLRYRPQTYSWISGMPFIALADKPIHDWANVQKLLLDKTLAAAALVLLSPIMALTALAVRLESKGPVFFKQKRFGFNNELIEVYKFRSMYVDQTDANAARLVTKGDPRVTRVGRFIRKSSIDELPQLFNVLRGELSLVGPRPHAVQANAADRLYHDAVEGYFARHRVKPGVTGWAQINGWRGETDTIAKLEKRVEHDIYYIDNWSLAFDLYILFRTPLALLKTDHAY